MKASGLIAAILIVAGCGGTTDSEVAQFEVQMLSVSGTVDGATLDGAQADHATGERNGDVGTFIVDGPDLSMQLSACPLAQLETDPYGGGGGARGGRPSGGPEPIGFDAGPGGDGGAPTGILPSADCLGRALFVCASSHCAAFAPEDIDLQIVEENGWRHLVTHATGAGGDVDVDLRYRETH